MAQGLSKDEIRNYPLSNGTTVDLLALVGTWTRQGTSHQDWGQPGSLEELAVGQVAYVRAMAQMRRGVITKIGQTKVHVTFTTQGAIEHQNRYQQGAGIRVQTTAASIGSVLVAPLSVAVRVTETLLAGDEDTIQDLADHFQHAGRRAVEQAEELLADLAPLAAPPVFIAPDLDGPLESPEETAEREAQEDARDLPETPEERTLPYTGSTVVEALEAVWAAVQVNHPELPDVVIVTGSGFVGQARWGHYRAAGWTGREQEETDILNHIRQGEVFVAGEALARGAEHVVETMLHEAAHVLADARDVQDTSRQGRWHNKIFLKISQELGLHYPHEMGDPKHGYSGVVLTDATRTTYAQVIADLDAAIKLTIKVPALVAGQQGGGEFIHGGRRPKVEGAKTGSTQLKLTCLCVDDEGKPAPRIIRASKTVAEVGQIHCTKCEDYFEVRD